ncbi:CD82 antigen-like isoform X1 [Arapaima gigas]
MRPRHRAHLFSSSRPASPPSARTMGKGCFTATKYFLFLFNLLFFLFGILLLGFGLWVLLDSKSFVTILQESSASLKVGCYVLIVVGSLSMLMGFLGCLGAIYEVCCLLVLYFIFLLLILIAQVTIAVLIYFQQDRLKNEMSNIVNKIIVDYTGEDKSTENLWDYIQSTSRCCGWAGPGNWTENERVRNGSHTVYPCSCLDYPSNATDRKNSGFCESPGWPVYTTGCAYSIEKWVTDNLGVILGICIGVAVIELLGMILSLCLCKNIVKEDYTKVPKY